MTTPLGEEFILIRPSLAGFRAELNAQVAAALTGVQPELQRVQGQLSKTAGGVLLPTGVRAAATETALLGATTRTTASDIERLSETSRTGGSAVKDLARELDQAETAAGRTARGLTAATLASTGLFRAVSFASGAFLVGAAAGAAIGVAVQEFRKMVTVAAQTNALLKATGEVAGVSASQVEELAKQQRNLTGTNKEEIQSAENVLLTFRSIRNEAGATNDVFTRSVKAVQDISSVFGTALTGSAVQLGKALQDPIRGVTALRRSGITLSQSQRDLIKSLVQTGQLLTAQKIILGEVEKQVGGTAAAIGQTLPGKLDILREKAKEDLGEYVKRISESQKTTQLFSETIHGLGAAFSTVIGVVKAGGSAIGAIGQGAAGIPGVSGTFQALGGVKDLVRNLTIAAAAFGGLKLALGTATFAQQLYTKATTVATVATEAEGAAAVTTTERIGLGAAAINALKGPLGITIGVTALTIAFIKLRDIAANAPGGLRATERALRSLNDAVEQGIKLQNELAGRRENVSLARFDVQAAQRTVDQLQARSAASGAQPGSLLQRDLANQITEAERKLADAEKALAVAEQNRDRTLESLNNNERQRSGIIDKNTQALLKQIAALREAALIPVTGGRTAPADGDRGPQRVFAQTQKLLEGLSGSSDLIDRTIGKSLLTVLTVLNKIPTQKQITIAVKLAGQGASTNDIVRALLGIGVTGEVVRQRGLQEQPLASATLHEQTLAAQAQLDVERKKLATVKQTAATRQQELVTQQSQLQTAKDALQTAKDQQTAAEAALASARQAARDAKQNLLDTIAAGKQAINDAVTSAKSNLDQLGQAIASALGKLGGGVGQNSTSFHRLRDQILSGKIGSESGRTQAQIQASLAGSTASSADKTAQKFADLTDALDRGKISLPEFNREFNKLLKGFDIKKFRAEFGTALTNTVLDEIKFARKQAAAIAGGPQRPGGGTAETLVKPLDAVKQATRDVASANRQVVSAVNGIKTAQHQLKESNDALLQAERKLRAAQSAETKANTAAIAANTKVNAELVRVTKAKAGLKDKQKPQGDAAKAANDQNAVIPGPH